MADDVANTGSSATAASTRCVAHELRKLTRLVTRYYDRHLAAVGIRAAQYVLLNALAQMGPANGTALAAWTGMDASTLSRALLHLRRLGWVCFAVCVDQRSKQFELTADGRMKLENARPHWFGAQEDIRRLVGSTSLNALLELSVRVSCVVASELRSCGRTVRSRRIASRGVV